MWPSDNLGGYCLNGDAAHLWDDKPTTLSLAPADTNVGPQFSTQTL